MKKIVALVLTLMLALSVTLSASAETELKIYLFGEAQNMDKVLEKFYADSGLDIKLNIVWNTGADHREKMPLLIGNEETCDLVFDAYWMNMSTMISQEMYADLSSYFNNDEYPGLKAAFSESYLAQVTDESGAIYAIPFTQAANDLQCIYYRADLAEKYGITVDSLENLEAYFKAVKENETDMVAPFGIGGSRAMYYLESDILEKKQAGVFEFSGTGTAVGMEFEVAISEDGKTVLGAGTIGAPDEYYANFPAPYNTNTRSDRAINALTKWAQYTQPNSITEEDAANNLFYTGLCAAIEGNISGYETTKAAIEKIEGAKLGMFIYNENLRNMTPGFYVTSGQTAWNFLCVPYYAKNIDATMKFIDWIFQSEENHDLFELGILGEDFTLNDAGEYTKITGDNAYVFPGYELTWNPNFIRTNAALDEDVKAYFNYMNDPGSYTGSVLDGFVFDNQATPELTNAFAAVTAVQSEYIRPLMHGTYGDETEAKLAEYWEKAQAAGIEVIRQAVIDQVQAFLDAKNQ